MPPKMEKRTCGCKSKAWVSTNDGTFTLPNVPLTPGINDLVVTVTDVSGNTSNQTRRVTKERVE